MNTIHPAEHDPSLLDPKRWFEDAAGERIKVARQAREHLVRKAELKKGLGQRFLAPLEDLVREHFVGLVEFKDDQLVLDGEDGARYFFDVVDGTAKNTVEIQFIAYSPRQLGPRKVLAFWTETLEDHPFGTLSYSTAMSIARTTGTVLSDAVYRAS